MSQPFIQRFRQAHLRRQLPLANRQLHWPWFQKHWLLAILPLMLTWVMATGAVLASQNASLVTATEVMYQSGLLFVHYVLVFFITIIVEKVICRVRQQPSDPLYFAHAVVVALLIPESMSVIQMALGMTFGIVFGRVAFGGSGHYIIHPGLLAVAFLLFSFPEHASEVTSSGLSERWMYPMVIASAGVGLLYLLYKRMYAIHLLFGVLTGTILVLFSVWLQPEMQISFDETVFANGAFLILLVFVLPDASVQPCTSFAKFAYGVIFVVLSVLFLSHNQYATQALVNALLLLSVLSPMIDRMVMALLLAWRHKVQEHA